MNLPIETPVKTNHPLALAEKYDALDEKVKAAQFYRLAGEAAIESYENESALEYLNKALHFTPGDHLETRYNLMRSLEQVYEFTGSSEARSHNLANMATVADLLDDDQKRAHAAVRLVLFKLNSGQNQDAVSISRLAHRIAHIANAISVDAELHLFWGRALLRLGELSQAKDKFQIALTLSQENSISSIEADSLRHLGVISEENRDYSEAIYHYNQALNFYESLNDKRGKNNVLNNLGKVAYDQGEYTAALRYWNLTHPNYIAINDKPGSCRLTINQSALCLTIGDYDQAKKYSLEALALSQEIGLKFGECLALINLGLAYHYQNDPQNALNYAQQALALAEKMQSKRLEGYAHNTLGKVLSSKNNLDDSSEQFWLAYAIWHEMTQVDLKVEAIAGLAHVELNRNKLTAALEHVNSIYAIIKDGHELEGVESPFTIYWTCYQVLSAADDSRASEVLRLGHDQLMERANKIADDTARASFLEQVDIHKNIIAEFLAQS